jgi:hypothetical protein
MLCGVPRLHFEVPPVWDVPLVPKLPPQPDCVLLARCQRAAQRQGGKVLRRRTEPHEFGLILGGVAQTGLTLDELEVVLGLAQPLQPIWD